MVHMKLQCAGYSLNSPRNSNITKSTEKFLQKDETLSIISREWDLNVSLMLAALTKCLTCAEMLILLTAKQSNGERKISL